MEIFTDHSQDKDQQRFVEQIFENPAISPTEIIKCFFWDRAQQHRVEQNIETAAILLTGEIKEVPTFKREREIIKVPESRNRS